MISNDIALITAILIYISILSGLSPEKSPRHLSAFVKGFSVSLFALVIATILEAISSLTPKVLWLKTLIQKIHWIPLSSEIWFIIGVIFFTLGIIQTARYMTSYHERKEEEEEKEKQTKVCPNCGEIVNKIAKICHYCKHRFKKPKP